MTTKKRQEVGAAGTSLPSDQGMNRSGQAPDSDGASDAAISEDARRVARLLSDRESSSCLRLNLEGGQSFILQLGSAADEVVLVSEDGSLQNQSEIPHTSPTPSSASRVHPATAGITIDEALRGMGKTLLNAIGEGVALYTRTGHPLWTNDLVKGLSSAMGERIAVEARLFDREWPLPPPSMAIPADGLLCRSEKILAEDDRTYQVTITPLSSAAAAVGLPVGCLIMVIADVSATKKLQQKIEALDKAGAELMRLDAELIRKYNAHERLKLLQDRIVKFAATLLHFDHFAIRLLDEREDKLQLVIGHNLPPEYDAFIIRPRLTENGITGHVAASGLTYICDDIKKDPLYLPGVEGAKSSLTIPLRVNDKVIGVMNIESLDLGAFDEEDRQLGEIFARYIAMAINMLDVLVVERVATNQTITGRVTHELDEPMQDIAHQVELLLVHDTGDQFVKDHLRQISSDLVSIRCRIQDCAAGPQSLLGVEKAMADKTIDPGMLGKRVLIADDEPNIRRIIFDYLSMKGCKVKVFTNGTEAINELNANPGQFDLVLSDIRMPDQNGYEVFAAARIACPGVPVILMTGFGYDPHHSIVRAHQEGLQTVLFKPFQLTRLLEDVRKAMGIGSGTGSP